jgi:predicted porin
MKKSLVALATLAATGAVMAQATIYGRSDVAYGIKSYSNANGATHMKQQGVMDGANAGSRIGFRGTEDLGGGMKAHFVTEQGISPTNAASFGVRTATSGMQYDGLAGSTNQFDTGTAGAYSQGTNRQTYVGLEGGFGTVRVGYQYTSAYEVGTLSGFTSTSEGAIGGEIAHLWGSGAIGGTRANAITYMTPRMNGFQATVQMGSAGGREQTEWLSANTATGTTLDKQARTSLQIDYTAGPLRTGLAYTKFDASVSGRAAGTTTNNSVTAVASAPVITTFSVLGALSGWNVSPVTGNTTYSANLLQLAGSYDFGAVKVGLTLNSGTKDVTEGPSAVTFGTQPSAAAGNVVASSKYASRALSFMMPMGKMDLVGGMANASFEVGPTATNDWSTRQVGVKYNFSKRTIAYGYIGSSQDSLAATTGIKDKSGTVIGIDHQF